MIEEELVFIETTSPNLYDKMDAEYLHPERTETILKLKQFAQEGRIELKRLGELVDIKKDKVSSSTDTEYLCIELGDFDIDYGFFNPKTVNFNDAGTSKTKCSGGEILFSRLRPYLNKVTLLPEAVNRSICSAELLVFSPKPTFQEMGYLWLILRSEFVLNQTRHLTGGSTRPRVEEEDIADLSIPILSDKKLRLEINALILKTMNRYYSAFNMFKNIEGDFLEKINLSLAPKIPELFFTLADRPSDCPRPYFRLDPLYYHPHYYELLVNELNNWSKDLGSSVEKLSDICVPNGIGRWKVQVKTDNGITPRLGVENITGYGISWDCKYVTIKSEISKNVIRKNDILISSTGTGSTGRIDIYTEDMPAISDGHITIIRLKPSINPYYVLAYLKTEYGRRQLLRMERGTSGQIEMYPDDIEQLLIPMPNDKKIIESASELIKKIYDDIHCSKRKLREIRMKLSEYITGFTLKDEYIEYVTEVPVSTWKINRP